ncbi:MAG: hypothetical protein KC776_30000 [Myxococcales bacterium]|nr:hypothetical protein [Myxococcales bacterium]MCB9576104.1 hypothetical protein [Polyangiaceae bacterium]
MFANRLLAAACLCLALAAITTSAHAGDKALAESLFRAGRQLMEAGKTEEACKKFAASNAQDPSPGTLLNLAACNEKLGRTATAWANFKEAATMAHDRGRSEQQTAAEEGAARLEPGLSKLQINAPDERPEGFKVTRGETELSEGSFGVPLAVDPGDHEIEASAPGHAPWKTTVSIGRSKDQRTVTIPALRKLPEAAAPPPGAEGGDARMDTATSGTDNKTLGYVLAGVGGAALIGGGIFGILAQKQASDAQDDPSLCPDKKCTPAGRDEIDAAESKALISTIGVGVGVAAIGAGVVLILTSGDANKASKGPQVAPLVARRGGGLSLSGSF